MKVSIVTPTYNQANYIGRTIESILSQEGDFELEYIIVDGASTDSSVEIITQYAQQDSRVQWISEPDNGQSDAINKGLRMATGDIVAFLNSDDTYKPGTIAAVVEYAKKHPEADWYTGYCDIIDEQDVVQKSIVTSYKNFWLRHFSRSVLMVLNPISQPATFWTMDAMEQVGLINEEEHLVMDYEYWCRLSQDHKLHVLPQYLANFRITPETKSSTQTTQQFADEIRVAKASGSNAILNLLHHVHVAVLLVTYKLIR